MLCLNQKSFILAIIAVLNSVLPNAVSSCKSYSNCELLHFVRVFVSNRMSQLIVKSRTNTVKQEILYQTCTGPDVTMIG